MVLIAATGELLCEFPVALIDSVGFAKSTAMHAFQVRSNESTSLRARLLHGTRELNDPYSKLHELEFDRTNTLTLKVIFEDMS